MIMITISIFSTHPHRPLLLSLISQSALHFILFTPQPHHGLLWKPIYLLPLELLELLDPLLPLELLPPLELLDPLPELELVVALDPLVLLLPVLVVPELVVPV